ncbi:glycerophosphodiester phosphodiesterase family protein [Flammeovirga sp. EKP202]|uniref:glycerophosphodiester phosphodiesterase family protein n=1 Tax=Flammeovirga sp. EKP202 TaxID=2770592 RepID=UPI00165EE18A|nr:glycerophosphodiester phosphodiesterase family protein [Flammeovirga sp. EKP202]MBD0400667.1 glycerophosphodiester phosphodiesterase family protein [Flammeovirga sp. EKP202]
MKNYKLYITFALTLALGSCNVKQSQAPLQEAKVASPIASKNRAEKILDKIKNPTKDYVLAVAHRGDWRYAPENSLLSIQRCIDLGIDIVELDFRLTKDGHLVAMHDYTVDRTTTGKGKVSDMTLAEVKALRLKSNCGIRYSRQQVPTLEEVMELCKGKIMVNLDKTEGETVQEAFDILKKTGTVNQGIFKGDDSIEFMREKYGSLMDSIIYFPKVWPRTKGKTAFIANYNREISPIGYEMIFDEEECFITEEIKRMNQQGITVQTCALWDDLVAGHNDERVLIDGPDAAWGWLIDNGTNALMTDRPEELIKYLEERGVRNL